MIKLLFGTLVSGLVVIASCAKDGADSKQCCESADATAEAGGDYIYNVYQFPDELIQDWGETNRARFFTRLKLTANGYPDTVHLAIALDPDQDGEVDDDNKELEKIRFVVKPLPIASLPGLYILPVPAWLATGSLYHVYMSWDHAKRQVNKVMLVIDTSEREGEWCTRTSTGERDCQPRKGGMVFAEAERKPYDQAQARSMYLERKTFPAPAEQWSLSDMVAFAQMIRLYQLTGSPNEDLKLLETTRKNVWGDSADEQRKRLIGYADKVVDNFSNTFKGVQATNCVPKELKPDGKYFNHPSC